ncbi:hypothetical protein BJX63DRAFT_235880 [Aspergillus granulosus]|uniref:Uncharacterized protein n=1 Tax=Aspergillus granulosus TaxID=176169 RepID=A0ABR4HBN0_9EURO
MYREPSTAESTKNSIVKDPCAAARSAIRRQATVRRPSRYSGSALRNATLRSPFPRSLADEIEREANGLPRQSHYPTAIPTQIGDPFDLNSSLADNSRHEAGLRILGDALRYSRPGQRLRIPRNQALPDLHSHSGPAGDGGTRPDHQEHLSFTPRFTPAIAYHRSATPLAGPDLLRLSSMPRHDSPVGDVPSGSLLRRVGQRSINDANPTNREPLVDGLGDRQRSVDLEDDHANDAWETLLTTITPDTNLPSADSSFTSASASGTNVSRVGTSRSSATSLESLQSSLHTAVPTVQMTLDPYAEYSNPCDYPSSTGSDTESDGEITQQSLFRRYRRRMRQVDSMRRAHNLQSALNNPPAIPTISFAFSDSSGDQDLHHMQAILDRLARREDIPDDWWAAAGLSRTIGQRAGTNDESNDNRIPDGPSRQR